MWRRRGKSRSFCGLWVSKQRLELAPGLTDAATKLATLPADADYPDVRSYIVLWGYKYGAMTDQLRGDNRDASVKAAAKASNKKQTVTLLSVASFLRLL